jgi:uncharacterized phage protein (TIGR01671 family)
MDSKNQTPKRVIKFRVWHENLAIAGSNDFMEYSDKAKSLYDFFKNVRPELPHSWRDHLMQFTGLTDKNGKEIYEGDVLRFYTGSLNIKRQAEVYWFLYEWALGGAKCAGLCERLFELYDNEKEYIDAEVVGNVYENPELI